MNINHIFAKKVVSFYRANHIDGVLKHIFLLPLAQGLNNSGK